MFVQALKHLKRQVSSPQYKYLRRFKIEAGDVVIDLGANIGDVTDFFARRKAFVHSYEPNPHAFSVLSSRFATSQNVSLHQAAVSNQNGAGQLYMHEQHHESEVKFSQASSLKQEKGNVSNDCVDVELVNIKDVLAPFEHIKLLKIDIEGGEYQIMDEVLKQGNKIDYILLETHGDKNKAFEEDERKLFEKINASPHKEKIYTDWF
jgi:FkbM family methyltransferase